MAQFNNLRVYDELNILDNNTGMITHGGGKLNVYCNTGSTGIFGNTFENTVVRGKETMIHRLGTDGSEITVIRGTDNEGTVVGNNYEKTNISGTKLVMSSNMYGTGDPPSDGILGQMYFKLVN